MSLKDSCRFVRKSHCQGIILLCTDVRKDMELPVLFPMACTALDLKRDYCIIRHSLRCLRHLGVSFTGGTPFALSLNALRLPHATKSSKITSTACHFGDRTTVSCSIDLYYFARKALLLHEASSTGVHHPPLLLASPISSGHSPTFECGVLKKVDSGTGKLGYGFTDSVH